MPGAPPQLHFLDVWNPAYEINAMGAHLQVLLGFVADFREQRLDEEDVYVWWGKIRSTNRRQPLPHLEKILTVGAQLGDDEAREGHLYLTDYRALYVARVGDLVAADVRAADARHVPAYYASNNLECDFWYKLLDIRRLVADDTLAVIRALKELRNTAYGDRPVSLYGGMVDLPLLVFRGDERGCFDEQTKDAVIGDRWWAEFDAESVGVGKLELELRENLFGDEAWLALDPAARTFIVTAEKILRDHSADAAMDFAPVITALSKALEVTLNALFREVARIFPRDLRMVELDHRQIDIAALPALGIGQLANLLSHKRPLHRGLRERLHDGDWLVDDLPTILRKFAVIRNPGTHSTRVDRETAMGIRDALLGIGCHGDLVRLALVHPK